MAVGATKMTVVVATSPTLEISQIIAALHHLLKKSPISLVKKRKSQKKSKTKMNGTISGEMMSCGKV